MSKIRSLIAQFRHTLDPLRGLDESQWLSSVGRNAPMAVGVAVPDWRGVYSSVANLFPACLPVRDALTKRSAGRVAELILQTGASRVVFGSFAPTYIHLLRALEQASRKIEVYSISYGSFMQSNERTGWTMLQLLKQLVVEGRIKKLGFAKAGMAEVYHRLGVRSAFVMHTVDKVPAAASVPLPGGPHLGLAAVSLATWRKLPFAMLAAVTEIPDAVLHIAGAQGRVAEFVRQMRLDARISPQPLPQSELPQMLRSMHLNLYVTLSECCPMLPLESLAEGAPCLTGPNSHLFEDSAYLRSRLIVDYPERNDVIARYIRQALHERDEIIGAYRKWLPGYSEQCRRSVASFLDLSAAQQYLPRNAA